MRISTLGVGHRTKARWRTCWSQDTSGLGRQDLPKHLSTSLRTKFTIWLFHTSSSLRCGCGQIRQCSCRVRSNSTFDSGRTHRSHEGIFPDETQFVHAPRCAWQQEQSGSGRTLSRWWSNVQLLTGWIHLARVCSRGASEEAELWIVIWLRRILPMLRWASRCRVVMLRKLMRGMLPARGRKRLLALGKRPTRAWRWTGDLLVPSVAAGEKNKRA